MAMAKTSELPQVVGPNRTLFRSVPSLTMPSISAILRLA